MTTVINTPPSNDGSGVGLGLIAGIIIAIGVIGLFIYYGLPALRKEEPKNQNTNINIQLPPLFAPNDNSNTK